jgi:hypothetical protein
MPKKLPTKKPRTNLYAGKSGYLASMLNRNKNTKPSKGGRNGVPTRPNR